jgi:hypothetical protein
MGGFGSNFKGRKSISMLFPHKYMWAKGFIYIYLKTNLGLYIGKPKKPLYVNNSPNENFKPLNFAHGRNFAPKITYDKVTHEEDILNERNNEEHV